jgi:hypothetical protein
MDESFDDAALVCHRCGCMLERGEGSFWIVRINGVCDPSPPDLDASEPLERASRHWRQLLDAMDEMSEQELMDQVHRRLTLQLCSQCFNDWIERPAD